ncbi:hypothetical protein ZIOFF_063529 [Zingiber officinale]|uniref:Uncharacterized protein n=1 Tax=Zingiber officinale TaxID=94328 RepID=A0A8J5F1Q7_ZINOF|nr:hypothetical protein ZIOFF_063529 [Zingiber officinale]
MLTWNFRPFFHPTSTPRARSLESVGFVMNGFRHATEIRTKRCFAVFTNDLFLSIPWEAKQKPSLHMVPGTGNSSLALTQWREVYWQQGAEEVGSSDQRRKEATLILSEHGGAEGESRKTSRADEVDATIPTTPINCNSTTLSRVGEKIHVLAVSGSVMQVITYTTLQWLRMSSLMMTCNQGEEEAANHGIGEGTGKKFSSVGKQTRVLEETTIGCCAWAASKAGGYLVPEQEGQVEDQAVGDEL